MSDDTMAGSWLLHLSVIIKDDIYDGESDYTNTTIKLVRMCACAGYAVNVIDYAINEDGSTTIFLELPFDTVDDEDPGMVSLSIIDDLQYYVPYEVIGDEITGDDHEG
jgi:hypothetical protein